jgi:carboxymethylenebutenolidase
MAITESDVSITTPDGTCDAAFSHPSTGAYAAVIIWPDGFGLRPSIRGMSRRLASEGYAVLVPNPFYRVTKAPIFGGDARTFDFSNPADRNTLTPLMASINAEGAAERDATAFVAWLDRQPQVDTSKKIGTQGYCMGGALVMRTAAALPDRIGAAASFHGGGLVTDAPTSPHLLAPKMRARVYIAIASNDDQRQPDAKDTLREAFDAAGRLARIEVYDSLHGWCMPDMPADPAKGPIYNEPEAEKAWSNLLALYKTALA